MITLPEAIALTGATTGQVPCEASVVIPNLTAAQKTALAAFVTSLGPSWPGTPAGVLGVHVERTAAGVAVCTVNGVVVHPSAAVAVAQRTSGAVLNVIGQVP